MTKSEVKDLLDSEVFICMWCKGEFDITQGTWPQYNHEQEPILDADLNNRERHEFLCYECAG